MGEIINTAINWRYEERAVQIILEWNMRVRLPLPTWVFGLLGKDLDRYSAADLSQVVWDSTANYARQGARNVAALSRLYRGTWHPARPDLEKCLLRLYGRIQEHLLDGEGSADVSTPAGALTEWRSDIRRFRIPFSQHRVEPQPGLRFLGSCLDHFAALAWHRARSGSLDAKRYAALSRDLVRAKELSEPGP